VQNRWM